MNVAGHGCPAGLPRRGGISRRPAHWYLAASKLASGQSFAIRHLIAHLCGVTTWALIMLAAVCAPGQESAATGNLNFEVRAVWGGGLPRSFAGKISISSGSMEIVRNLSVQDDAVGTLQPVMGNEIRIEPHSPSSFGGVDLVLKCSAEAELRFEWDAANEAERHEPIRIKVSQLLRERWMEPMDQRGSQLAVERMVQDRIRASVNRGQSIFSSAERCTLTVEGYRNDLVAGDYRLNVRLIDSASGKAIAHFQRDVEVNDQGSFGLQTFPEIELPNRAGVYSFDIGLQRKRLLNSFINAAMASVDRKIEIVVINSERPVRAETLWRAHSQIYPAGSSWWDSLGRFRMPTVKSLSPLVGGHSPRPISSGEHGRRLFKESECMVLAHGGWQAFPLATQTIGHPHRLRIKIPNDQPQRLAFSLQESSSSGDTGGLRLDSGLVVERPTIAKTSQDSAYVVHELVFWPRTLQPYLLIFNPDGIKDASIAEVELDVAESELSSPTDDAPLELPTRLAAVYFDKPLLAENFGAVRRMDTKGHRELDSWQTVFESTSRMAAYTAWSGFNSAVVTAATQGGAIYPSQLLAPSPKFDSGLFLSDGSCPGIKDSLEAICRQFDRYGLKLVIALDLDGELPELDRTTSDNEKNAQLFQVNIDGNVAVRTGKSDSPNTHYNPLDARVQSALGRVLREILDRYSGHDCFAGIQLNLSERSHFNFAGDRWGYDASALMQYQRHLGTQLPIEPAARKQLLSGALRPGFVSERAKRLTGFYEQLADQVSKAKSDARLILNPSRLLAASPSPDNFTDVESIVLGATDILLGSGIDGESLRAHSNICLLRPEADSPLRPPVSRAWSIQVAGDTALDAMVAGPASGAIVQQIPTGFRLADFDKANPFGSEKSRTWLFPHASRGGDAARRALISRLFHADCQVLEIGGWLAPMGQEAALRPMLKVLTRMPPVELADVPAAGTSHTLRVRRGEYAEHTTIQLVNNASWSETITMELRTRETAEFISLDGSTQNSGRLVANQSLPLEIVIPPYGLAGIQIASSAVEILRLSSLAEAGTAESLDNQLNDLQSLIDRAGELNEQQTLGLRGGDFETWEPDGKPLGWTISSNPNSSVNEDHELPRSGSSCVSIENRANGSTTAWLQSDRIAIPTTGRLALEVWARSAPGQGQPTVRLSLIGRYRDGKRFQRWHEFVPSSKGGTQIPIDWGRRPLILLVPDVPNEELSELHVAIDLVGAGRLWVDDVRVYGMYLHPDEKVHLLGQMFLAKDEMRKGNFSIVERLLNSFWASFLSATMTNSPAISAPVESAVTQEAKLPSRTSASPAWRSSAPRLNQWQETLRQRWQR